MTASISPSSSRLYFLDWLRIIAFFILILYHIGMYYVTDGWHVKSVHASDTIAPLMLLSSPWRLALLFFISGVATRFLLQKISLSGFVRQRSWRLLVPLIFGMLVIVPPQAYFEVVEKVAYSGSYGQFMGLYLRAYHGFCQQKCLDLPTWNHLWFVAYLWLYTMLLAAILSLSSFFGARISQLTQGFSTSWSTWKIWLLPIALLAIARISLVGQFPATHDVVHDWYNHALYFPLFLFGASVAKQSQFWQQLDQLRWPSLATALMCWAMLTVYYATPDNFVTEEAMQMLRTVQRGVFAICQWMAICAACGFAHHHLQFDSAKRRYLSQAVFPVYILHQSLIVIFAHSLKPWQFAPLLEAAILLILTFGCCFLGVEIVRRVPWLRPLFGLGPLTEAANAAKVPRVLVPAN